MDWIIAKGNHHYSSGSTTLISPFTQADEVGTYQHYQETVDEINRLYNEGTISTYEREQMLEEAEFKRTHSLEQTRIQTQFQYERNKPQPALAYQEQGFLTDFNSIDIEVGIEDNTFQIGINKADSMKMGIELGDFLYCEGTEFGGIIDGRIMDTQEEEIIWTGTCFRGLIQNDIIRPLSGQNYRVVSGEANAVLRTLLSEEMATP